MCHTSRGARGPPGLGRPPSGPSDLWDTLHLCDHFSLQLSNSGRLAELASETLVVRATRLPPGGLDLERWGWDGTPTPRHGLRHLSGHVARQPGQGGLNSGRFPLRRDSAGRAVMAWVWQRAISMGFRLKAFPWRNIF